MCVALAVSVTIPRSALMNISLRQMKDMIRLIVACLIKSENIIKHSHFT